MVRQAGTETFMRTIVTILAAGLVLAASGGCTKFTTPAGPTVQLTPAQQRGEALWQSATEVLRKYNFVVDRQDRRAGIITTLPLTGQYFGEFWRRDAVTRFDLEESTVQTIYRSVTVTIAPATPGGDLVARVEARTYRSDLRQAQITSTADAYNMFPIVTGSERPSRSLLLESRRTTLTGAVPLGRDADLEARLEAEINAAAPPLAGTRPASH
jgi:hypothetical protein